MPKTFHNILFIFLISAVLSSCGGGGNTASIDPVSNTGESGDTSGPSSDENGLMESPNSELGMTWTLGEYAPFRSLAQLCADPRNNQNYSDLPGTISDENNWIRSYSNDTYLWYSELPDIDPRTIEDPLEYFELMKTNETTISGTPKDKYHYTEDTEVWNQYFRDGTNVGYGMRLIAYNPPESRRIFVAYNEPHSPAEKAGIARGTEILSVDGEQVAGGNIEILSEGIYPQSAGETHSFEVIDLEATEVRVAEIQSAEITLAPVRMTETIEHKKGNVGYMLFNQHIGSAEIQLVEAITNFKQQDVDHLVLDLRYNGGGYLSIANQLAFMVAGNRAQNQVFERLKFNDKHLSHDPITQAPIPDGTFLTTTVGMSADSGQPLPTLNLERVYILTTSRTCSASEAVINGLRGIDVEVVLIGSATCGKPYGFYGIDNCGTTYLTIQFKGENAKGFGDYGDGFLPSTTGNPLTARVYGCSSDDQILQRLGDKDESMLSSALYHIEHNRCPGTSSNSGKSMSPPHLKPIAADSLEGLGWGVKLL